MEYTRIPNLNIDVSRIGLGTWAIGGWMWGGTDEKNAIATIHQALEMGINLIDTAPVYGFGTSEEIVGKALKQYGKRDSYVVATKLGLNWTEKEHKIFRDCSRTRVRQEVEDSLKRLQVEAIDLYQVHWPDPKTPIAETAEVLAELLKEGKVRALGVSNYSVEQMNEFQKIIPLSTAQPPYNLFEREADQEILPYCKKMNMALLGYGSLCRGLLTGKMRPDTKFEGDDLRKSDPKFQPPRYEQYLECVKRLDQWSQEHYKKPVLALAIRYALDKGINIPLWGMRKPDQLKSIDSVLGWSLTQADLKAIENIVNECIPHPVGPEFMAPPK